MTDDMMKNNNSPIQDYVHPDDQTHPTFIILLFIWRGGTNSVAFSTLVSSAAIFGMSHNAPKNGCEDFQRKSARGG